MTAVVSQNPLTSDWLSPALTSNDDMSEASGSSEANPPESSFANDFVAEILTGDEIQVIEADEKANPSAVLSLAEPVDSPTSEPANERTPGLRIEEASQVILTDNEEECGTECDANPSIINVEDELREKLTREIQNKNEVDRQLSQMRLTMLGFEQNISELRKALDAKTKVHDVELKKANNEIQFLRTQRTALEHKLQSLEQETVDLSSSLEAETRRRFHIEGEMDGMKDELRVHEKKSDEYLSKMLESQKTLRELKKISNDEQRRLLEKEVSFDVELRKLQSQLEHEESQALERTSRQGQADGALSKSDAENQKLRMQLEEAENDVGVVNEKLAITTTELQVLDSMLAEANKNNAKMKTTIDMYEKQMDKTDVNTSEKDIESTTAINKPVATKSHTSKTVSRKTNNSNNSTKSSTPWTFERRLVRERTDLLKSVETLTADLNQVKLENCNLLALLESEKIKVSQLQRENLSLKSIGEKSSSVGVKRLRPMKFGRRFSIPRVPVDIDSTRTAPTERKMKINTHILGSRAYAPDLWTFFMGQFSKRVVKAEFKNSNKSNTLLMAKLDADTESESYDSDEELASPSSPLRFHAVEKLPQILDDNTEVGPMSSLTLTANPDMNHFATDVLVQGGLPQRISKKLPAETADEINPQKEHRKINEKTNVKKIVVKQRNMTPERTDSLKQSSWGERLRKKLAFSTDVDDHNNKKIKTEICKTTTSKSKKVAVKSSTEVKASVVKKMTPKIINDKTENPLSIPKPNPLAIPSKSSNIVNFTNSEFDPVMHATAQFTKHLEGQAPKANAKAKAKAKSIPKWKLAVQQQQEAEKEKRKRDRESWARRHKETKQQQEQQQKRSSNLKKLSASTSSAKATPTSPPKRTVKSQRSKIMPKNVSGTPNIDLDEESNDLFDMSFGFRDLNRTYKEEGTDESYGGGDDWLFNDDDILRTSMKSNGGGMRFELPKTGAGRKVSVL